MCTQYFVPRGHRVAALRAEATSSRAVIGRRFQVAAALAALTLIGITDRVGAETAASAKSLSTTPEAAVTSQQTFETPEAAAKAFVAALAAGSDAGYRTLFGPEIDRLEGSDSIAAEQDQKKLLDAAKESLVLQPSADESVTLVLGAKRWPLPIPLVRSNGSWRFDTPAGIDELLNRRIGANELAVIDLARSYVLAQRAFASEDREGNDILEYARSFTSTPGKHDGLYWEAAPDEPQSPFGPYVAAAGDYAKGRKPGDPFKGYYYRILEGQGSHAPGGAYGYVINGHMVAGFALVAFPADYGVSGVMTFIVGPQGKLFEKDLGPKTAQIATAMTAYDPDSSWKPVMDDE